MKMEMAATRTFRQMIEWDTGAKIEPTTLKLSKSAEAQKKALKRAKGMQKEFGVVAEEFLELKEALEEGDKAHVLKEAADLLYSLLGFCSSLDLNIVEAFAIVHMSNMSKVPDAASETNYIKDENFMEANMEKIANEPIVGHKQRVSFIRTLQKRIMELEAANV